MLTMPFGTFDTNKKHYLKKKKPGVRLGRGPRVDPGLERLQICLGMSQ